MSTIPFSHFKTELFSFSSLKLPWIILYRNEHSKNKVVNLDALCNSIVSTLHESGAESCSIKCAHFQERTESYNYPIIHTDSNEYYDFSVEYQNLGIFHYYHFKTPFCPRSINEIANLRYLIYLDSLDLPVHTDTVGASSMILAPNALSDSLYYLLWNKGNYQKKRKRKYYDTKFSFSSNPYNMHHAGIEKMIDGKKSRAVTLVRNGVLLHLPLNKEESKKAGQRYIPNTFKGFEVKSGSMPLETMIQKSENTLLIYELRGSVGDDGSYSGVVKNGFIIRNGVFTERLYNAPIFFNIPYIYNHIDILSLESVSFGYLLAPYIKFDI